ncbi:myosin VIIA, isoform CRA_d, partial [Blyttiomyces helicus]
VRPMHPSSVQGVEDMITLGDLHEAALFYNLSLRMNKDEIYTYTGNILIAINPYKTLPIYDLENVRKYKGVPPGELPPHVFAIANETFCALSRNHRNQCVVISGESGAGKTETTKLILQYLAAVSTKHSLVQEQILDASPILEAFGNAKTVRNNNSSRFGKFIEVQFGQDGSIMGAKMLEYLLEKSRVVSQSPDERNYHIFYNLLAGAPEELATELTLGPIESYFYLTRSGCMSIAGVDDAADFLTIMDSFATLKFGDVQKDIMRVLSAILHLGNLSFEGGDGETLAISMTNVINVIGALTGIDSGQLVFSLINRTTITRGEKFVTPLTRAQVEYSRDAMAKALYGRMFTWIVSYINETTTSKSELPFVGVLDIFGFEDFAINSFEQFCINYANERLQFFFNQHIFKLEQEEYDLEGIDWKKIDFVDNQPCIDLISKKPLGLIFLLDEESNFPKSSDHTCLSKFHTTHEKHPNYGKPKTPSPIFALRHYAGEVVYQVSGFLEKNRDTLRADLTDLLAASTNPFIATLFKAPPEVVDEPSIVFGTNKGSSAAGTKGASLSELIATLASCNPYFVRCIKPNTQKIPNVMDRGLVMAQLKYSGMLETIRIRQAGFSVRTKFSEFVGRYGILAPNSKFEDSRARSAAVMKTVNVTEGLWALGKTKIFFKSQVESILESSRGEILLKFVQRIQAWARMLSKRANYLRTRSAISTLQRGTVLMVLSILMYPPLRRFKYIYSSPNHSLDPYFLGTRIWLARRKRAVIFRGIVKLQACKIEIKLYFLAQYWQNHY